MRLVPSPMILMVGLPTGLQLIIDNAIPNAVKHDGDTEIQLIVSSSREGVEIAIDGSGVLEIERAAVFKRSIRGSTASSSGPSLGLALVIQQAELHGRNASLHTKPIDGTGLLSRLADNSHNTT